MISTRDRAWWQSALRRGRPIAVVETGELVVGYAAYGRTRSRALGTEAEIDELYLLPEYQGVGLGRRLFRAVRNDLADHGLTRLGVWSLEDNVRAGAFYEGLGGVAGPRALDRVAGIPLPKVGFCSANVFQRSLPGRTIGRFALPSGATKRSGKRTRPHSGSDTP